MNSQHNTNTHPSPCIPSRFSTLPGPGPASSKGSFSIHLLRSLSRSPAEPMVSHRHYRPIAPFPTGPEGQGFYRVRKEQRQKQGSPQPSLRPRSARYVTRCPERVRSVPRRAHRWMPADLEVCREGLQACICMCRGPHSPGHTPWDLGLPRLPLWTPCL